MVILTYNCNLGGFFKYYLFKKYKLPKNYSFSGKIYETIKDFPNKKPLTLFIKNNKLHRYFGPAAQYKSLISNVKNSSGWYFNEKVFGYKSDGYSQSQFFKDLNKQWLS